MQITQCVQAVDKLRFFFEIQSILQTLKNYTTLHTHPEDRPVRHSRSRRSRKGGIFISSNVSMGLNSPWSAVLLLHYSVPIMLHAKS